MNNIITFYSYKGGVGRSMSLANVSILLNKWGYKVLIVDWDLEAPGLEHFFKDFFDLEIIKSKIGIIDLLDYQEKYAWQDALIPITVEDSKVPIHFISSGLRDETYFKKVRNFSVDDFYGSGGGRIIENLRDEWKKHYDFILIDSRTGITEIGGICTIQLPDKIVLLFTATEQGFEGTLDIANRATKAQQKLPFDRQKLLFIPIPTKFDIQAEYQLSQYWLDVFAKDLMDIYKIWLPISVQPRDFLEKTKIPYVSYFSFGEKLPVIEQGMKDPTGLGYAYENLAALIANDLNPVESLISDRDKFIEKAQIDKKSGEEQLNEAKLILLGDGRSGKTSLANRLLKNEFPKEADRTDGVDIVTKEYSFPLANGMTFKINIWDFAGQDKYKTLHQLFYTESCIYVLVAEAGNMTTDYDDWFQTAALFGKGSPLVLVLNEFKAGLGMGNFDSNYWKKRYPELLKEVFTVNLATNKNLSAVEEYIRLLAQTLPHTKYVFPSNWAAIRRVLNERRNEQYITLTKYFEICKNNNLPDRENALILSNVLHKIGDCLHFQKNEILKQFIILKIEWAAEAVYKIFDDKIVAEDKGGFFNLSDLERIWDSVEYENMRPQLLELMKQFNLAYQLPRKEEFVSPPLLPAANPSDLIRTDLDSLELYIEYEFLPKALLTQFIVTRHADIAEGRTLVWRNGVVLKWDDEALAEVFKTKFQGRDAFHIQTQGNNRKGMMTVILKTFRELQGHYKGIKYSEKLPCTCEGCRTGKNIQYYFDFVNLLFRLEKGRYEVECDNSLEKLNVTKFLENNFVFEKYKEGRELQLKENVVRVNPHKTRMLKLFLASSNELENEQRKIEIAISRKNDTLKKQGVLVDLLIWEGGKHIGKSLHSQDNFNLEIEQCDLFVMLFYSKISKYSSEEFEKAKSLFDKEAMPRIHIFQKNKDLPKYLNKADADSRFEFLERLNKLEYFPILFDNTDQLINELENAIDKLLQDEAFVKQLKVE